MAVSLHYPGSTALPFQRLLVRTLLLSWLITNDSVFRSNIKLSHLLYEFSLCWNCHLKISMFFFKSLYVKEPSSFNVLCLIGKENMVCSAFLARAVNWYNFATLLVFSLGEKFLKLCGWDVIIFVLIWLLWFWDAWLFCSTSCVGVLSFSAHSTHF